MPVILLPESFAEWLDPKNDDVARLQRLLVPAAVEDWELVPVGPTVNSARNETSDCLAPPDSPAAPTSVQAMLF
jgi:putative SOS response-associated peptidase YedK